MYISFKRTWELAKSEALYLMDANKKIRKATKK